MDKHMEKWHFYYLEYYYAEHDIYCICLCRLWSFSSVLIFLHLDQAHLMVSLYLEKVIVRR